MAQYKMSMRHMQTVMRVATKPHASGDNAPVSYSRGAGFSGVDGVFVVPGVYPVGCCGAVTLVVVSKCRAAGIIFLVLVNDA